MKDKMITVESISNDILESHRKTIFYDEGDLDSLEVMIKDKLIEFAKLHVKAALKAASKNAKAYSIEGDDSAHMEGNIQTIIIKNSILNAYPEDLIK